MKLPPVHINAPAAIAFSGGGDSTALLHACRDNPHINHAFIIDHALRDRSCEEVAGAAKFARGLGYKVKTRRWSHSGVSTGLQVKARVYRYTAMGEMCREENLQHLLTAHTKGDQAETLLMRLDRQTGWRGLAGMAPTAYGPIWPALAGVTLHRPWLKVSRADLRTYLANRDLGYVDDPSNENRDFSRVRARQALSADPNLRDDVLAQQKKARAKLSAERQIHAEWMKAHARINPQGFIETDSVPPVELLLHILNVVSGRGGPIDAAKRARVCADMERPDFKAATLSGGWVLKKQSGASHGFVYLRDRVAVTGRDGLDKLQSVTLAKHRQIVWDGRFFCTAKSDGIRIEPAFGHLQKLRQLAVFKRLFELPKAVRPTIPVYFVGDDPVGFGACETKYVSSTACSALRLQALNSNQDSVPI